MSDKICFVIMPISDFDGYPFGHFKRVYDYLIKPACEKAGFIPVRSDDVQNTNYIALDIVKQIVNADMALCDLSSRNPNVLYELGIRQAFNKPVTLIKDNLTDRVFDISGFRDVAYDETLRVDTVEVTVETIASTIKNTYESKGKEINSLVALLGIEAAHVEKQTISNDTQLVLQYLQKLDSKINELEAAKIASAISKNKEIITKVRQQFGLTIGDVMDHSKFGIGIVRMIEGSEQNPVVTVEFDSETKKLMLNYAKFNIIGRTTKTSVEVESK